MPPLRPELQAAHDEMDAKGDYFAYAVCRTHDDLAWEVNTRQGNIYSAIDGTYADHDEAMAASVAWLEQLDRASTSYELDGINAWNEYQATGLHVTMEDADAWLAQMEVGQDVEPPKPIA